MAQQLPNGDQLQFSGSFNYSKCLSIDESNNNTLYTIKRSFYKSLNQGTSWTRFEITGVQQPNVIMRVANSNSQIIYAVETDWYNGPTYVPQRLRRGSNGGFSWKDLTANLPANIIIADLATDPAVANRIYITCYGNVAGSKVFRSLDGGLNWSNLSFGLPNVNVRCMALVNETKKGIYVGTHLGVYYRDNNVGNWIRFSNGLPIVQINNLYNNTTLQALSAATFGRGIFVSDLYDPSTCPTSLTLNSIYFNLTTYAASGTINSAGTIYPGA